MFDYVVNVNQLDDSRNQIQVIYACIEIMLHSR